MVKQPGLVNNYKGLFALLFEINFSVTKRVPMDRNRALDGQALRNTFLDIHPRNDSELDAHLGACRMLEFLIGVAERMNHNDWDYEEPDRIPYFFWILITNLGLDVWDDEALEEKWRTRRASLY